MHWQMGNRVVIEIELHAHDDQLLQDFRQSVIAGAHDGTQQFSFLVPSPLMRAAMWTHLMDTIQERMLMSHRDYDGLASQILDSISPPQLPAFTNPSMRPTTHMVSSSPNMNICSICMEPLTIPQLPFDIILQRFQIQGANEEEQRQNNSNEQSCFQNIASFLIGEIRTLPCLHAFHMHCIDPWLLPRFGQSDVAFDCPVCRQIVN
jgi:hypothetical protein